MEQDRAHMAEGMADTWPEDDWARIAAYLAGEGSPEMHRETARQIAESERLQQIVAQIRKAESVGLPTSPVIDQATARRRLHARLQAQGRQRSTSQVVVPRVVSQQKPRRLGWVAGIVAAVAVAIAIPVTNHFWSSAQAVQSWEYATRRAEQASFTLPDGSHVVLAPDTRLQYRQNGMTDRTVTLDGQAYFTVTHSPSQQFVVHAGNAVTRVLGTSFGVRAYRTDRATEVAVAEGKVTLENAGDRVTLLPGDVGVAVGEGMPQVTHDARIVDVFGWMRNQISFQDVPLRDVVGDMERQFDLEIEISNSTLAARRFSGVIKGKSGYDALESIAFALGARLEWNGRRVTFSL